jgi:predicted nucleic acid-binding protein
MKPGKFLIFDAGPLINFSMNGILPLLEKLKKEFNGEFVITKEVKHEIIDRPINIKRFELGALKLKDLFDRGIIKHAPISEQQINQLRKIRDDYLNIANSTFITKKRNVHLLDKGEAAALALSKILNNAPLVVDERTTRILCENPENLRKLFEKKLHTNVRANKKNYKIFQDFKIIRSTELAFIAFKKGLFQLKDPRTLEAMLYGLKYKGCSISEKEIEEVKSFKK